MYITAHAMEAYLEFYPNAELGDVMYAFNMSVETHADIVVGLARRAGRRPDSPSGSYFIHPERTGIFVISPEGNSMITFLRLYSLAQHLEASSLYPNGWPITAEAPWVDALLDAPPALRAHNTLRNNSAGSRQRRG